MAPQQILIFDSSSLISLAMNGLLPLLKDLKNIFKGKFIITEDVRKEVIDRPLTIKRFELEALMLKQLLDDKILEMPENLGIKNSEVGEKTEKIMNVANNLFISEKKEIKLIGLGEASCLALSKILSEKKIRSVISIDERTTRVLCENPEQLKKFLEKKMHTKVNINKKNFVFFKDAKIIRSAELVYIAYKKKLVKFGDGKLLDALLWAVKLKGCSISDEEIEAIKKFGGKNI